jgi:hypothetical protein
VSADNGKIDTRGLAETVLAVKRVALPVISATSPTLAETMRACRLRAGLSRAAGSGAYVLGNPKAWLGTAYHEVLEKIATVEVGDDVDSAALRLWNLAIASLSERSSRHPLDRRFASPEGWPGYHIARASALLRAKELSATRRTGSSASASGGGDAGTIRERQFVAFGGKLVGKPDVIRQQEVVDYKSGAILEYDETSQSDVVKAAYVRQLRIYGFLVKEVLGWWPARGILLPFVGPGVEVPLDPGECASEAAEAVALLDAYNAKVNAIVRPDELAEPSPAACQWCSFKLMCAPFWSAVSPEWSGGIDGAVVEGVVPEPPRTIHGGAAVSLAVDVESGTEEKQRVQLAPLSPNSHPALASVVSGDRVRLVGLRRRPDGSVVPTQRTVLARVEEIPVLDSQAANVKQS